MSKVAFFLFFSSSLSLLSLLFLHSVSNFLNSSLLPCLMVYISLFIYRLSHYKELFLTTLPLSIPKSLPLSVPSLLPLPVLLFPHHYFNSIYTLYIPCTRFITPYTQAASLGVLPILKRGTPKNKKHSYAACGRHRIFRASLARALGAWQEQGRGRGVVCSISTRAESGKCQVLPIIRRTATPDPGVKRTRA